jgi:hypothetical protein
MDTPGVSWWELESAAPDLAGKGRATLERWGFVYVATIRSDGTPRISPVEAHLVQGRLVLALIGGSRKVRDLGRNDHLTLQSPVASAGDPGTEVKLRGHATAIGDDDVLRDSVADAVQERSGWRPTAAWALVELSVTAAAVLSWSPEGDLELLTWDSAAGVQPTRRMRLDPRASRYRAFPS